MVYQCKAADRIYLIICSKSYLKDIVPGVFLRSLLFRIIQFIEAGGLIPVVQLKSNHSEGPILGSDSVQLTVLLKKCVLNIVMQQKL